MIKRKGIVSACGLGDNLELMAVIALGYPDEKPKSSRKKLAELIVVKK